MPIRAQAADDTIHEFPDGTPAPVIDKAMRSYAGSIAASQKEPETSQALGFEQGVGHFLANAATPAIAAGEKLGIPMDWAKEGQQVIRNPPNKEGYAPGKIGRFAADVTETIPTMLAGPFVGGAMAGYQLRDEDTAQGAATSALLGGIGGKLGDKLVRGVSSAVAPKISPYVKALLDEKVRLTPGQIVGGTTQRVEDRFSSIPFLGDMISNARIRGLEDFNRAAINRSIAPIGTALPDGLSGRGAVDFASQALSDNYNRILGQATFKVDPAFTANVANLKTLAQNIPQYGVKPIEDFIQTNIAPRLSQAGTMSGKEFKEVDELLGQEIRDYTGGNPNDRKLARAFQQLQAELKDGLGRSNPNLRAELDSTDAGFANLVRIQDAAVRGGGAKGVDPGTFTPAQLSAAIKATDKSARKNAVARGNALMQDLSDAGQAVLPQQVPNSGTPERIAAMLLAGGTLGHVVAPGAAAPIAALTGAYTKPGVSALAYALTKRPPGANALANALRNNSKTAALPAAIAASQLLGGQ